MPSEHYGVGLFLLQMNSNFSVGLDTKWPKGIWTCWTNWGKKFRSFATTERSDSTTSQLNMTRNNDYKPKRKNRNLTSWLDVLLVLCTPWVALYSTCTANNTINKEAGKFPSLANSRINCRLRFEMKSVFIRSAFGGSYRRLVFDTGAWFWEKMGGVVGINRVVMNRDRQFPKCIYSAIVYCSAKNRYW